MCPIFAQDYNFDLAAVQNECISRSKKDKGVVKSNVGGWQSNILFKEDSFFSHIISNIEFSSIQFARQLKMNEDLKVGGFWININKFKDYNQYHTHPQSIFSGVYYIKVPKNSGSIIFKNPSSLGIENNWYYDIKEYNSFNSCVWEINPYENKLLIFPGWLEHQVLPNLNCEERITLSFNVVRR